MTERTPVAYAAYKAVVEEMTRASAARDAANVALAAAEQRVRDIEAELLRVRTTGHGAAHELDNIAIELGLGHSPQAGVVAAEVRRMKGNEQRVAALTTAIDTVLKRWGEANRQTRMPVQEWFTGAGGMAELILIGGK